jgi:hypothetical protein
MHSSENASPSGERLFSEPPVDPLAREDEAPFDWATSWVPFQRLAASVILHAAVDRKDTWEGSPARARIDDFLFGKTPAARVMRDHWFQQCGLAPPTTEQVWMLIRRVEVMTCYRTLERR